MKNQTYKEDKIINCINCFTGKTENLIFRNGILANRAVTEKKESNFFVGRGLVDLQVNGINGIDFNNPSLTRQNIVDATRYLLSQGVTTFFPTVITNSDENTLAILHTIYQACIADSVVDECIWGIHLEGPFISAAEGAKGAHDAKYIKPPDWKLFSKFQEAAGGKIKIVTIAPEREGAVSFIHQCRSHAVLVSIGHSLANTQQVNMAVKSGATLSTHLGNGVPLLLPRHPNIIWDQLAAEELYACIITDGLHTPDSFMKAVIKNKGNRTIIVSDSTYLTGMPPGEYKSHIGGTVILDKEKRVSIKSSPGLLAGAAKSLLENIEILITHNLATLAEAWQMGSENAAMMLAKEYKTFNERNDDIVLFQWNGKQIQVEKVIKNKIIVFERS
ncbi:MAG: hypothetical protein ABIR19_08105 [Ginsengibacter sp.]